MEIIIHRVNTLQGLRNISKEYGTEIDIRAYGSNLILNHEPFQNGELLEAYLDEYQHGTLILNIKEAGIEDEVLRLVRMRQHIKSYFLLDVELPYLYHASLKGERDVAVRFSEVESIETVKKFINKVDWIWIDTQSKLPIRKNNINILNYFKTCLVCPERWGRSEDIYKYLEIIKKNKYNIKCVMTSYSESIKWNDIAENLRKR